MNVVSIKDIHELDKIIRQIPDYHQQCDLNQNHLLRLMNFYSTRFYIEEHYDICNSFFLNTFD